MFTGLGVIAMLITGILLRFREMTKIYDMLDRRLDDHGDAGSAEQ